MQQVKLLCARCGTALVPALTGPRCPRLAACGFGGIVETLRFQPTASFASTPSEA